VDLNETDVTNITDLTIIDANRSQGYPPLLYVLRKKKSRLLRWWIFWQIALPAATFCLSLISMRSFEQRVVLCALFVGAGFCGVAGGVGPRAGLTVAVIIFFGALLGPIAFSWTVALAVALIGGMKLKRIQHLLTTWRP